MKNFIGLIIFAFGIGILIGFTSADVNIWYAIAICILIGFGLELTIDGKVEKLRQELKNESK